MLCWSVSTFTGLLYGSAAALCVCVCVSCLNVDNWFDWHYLKKKCGCECMFFGRDIFGASCPYFFSKMREREEKGGTGKSFSHCIFSILFMLSFCVDAETSPK